MISQQGDFFSYLLSIILLFLFYYLMTELQKRFLELNIKNFLEELEIYENSTKIIIYRAILKARKDLLEKAKSLGAKIKYEREFMRIQKRINEVLESFLIDPVTLDPRGVIDRLEHLLNVRERRLEGIADQILPNAPEDIKRNLENILEAAAAIHSIYKLTRHYYEASKFYNSPVILYQLQLILPVLKGIIRTYYDAQRAFSESLPIGDSVGPLVASRFFSDEVFFDEETKFSYSINNVINRKVIAAKAMGPGGNVGHPGKFLEKIINQEKVDLVITVDAAIKFEGEETGEVAVGVGAAIGDPGPEKFRIEQLCTEKKIPLFAVIIKESIVDAVIPFSKKLSDSIERACEEILKLIEEETKEGDTVVILGIGNSVGIGNIKVIK